MMKPLEVGDKVLNCNSVAVHRGRIGVVSAVRDNLVWAKYEDGQETYMKSFDYQRIEDIEGDVLFERLTDSRGIVLSKEKSLGDLGQIETQGTSAQK